MSFAFFRLPSGQAWMGTGPFTEHEAPPSGCAAFYVNDFSLSDAKPWKVPARLTPVNDANDLSAFVGEAAPVIAWEKPATEWFKMAFRRIRRDVLTNKIRKMVPVLTEQGTLQSGDMRHLLARLWQAPTGLWSYAWLEDQRGFLGATPELLMQIQGRRLETMALAGTAKPNGLESFVTDAKEIEEHEIVASFLDETLRSLGKITRTPRSVREAAGLTHFHTQISVALERDANLNELIKLLHPTPAVGCLPRDEVSLAKLMEYRRQLRAPAFFGAPFGFKMDDVFHCVVAIRSIGWEKNEVSLPSGCGIVGGSAFDHEWRELRLKREAVARLLGV